MLILFICSSMTGLWFKSNISTMNGNFNDKYRMDNAFSTFKFINDYINAGSVNTALSFISLPKLYLNILHASIIIFYGFHKLHRNKPNSARKKHNEFEIYAHFLTAVGLFKMNH